jgi:hypothetical protein
MCTVLTCETTKATRCLRSWYGELHRFCIKGLKNSNFKPLKTKRNKNTLFLDAWLIFERASLLLKGPPPPCVFRFSSYWECRSVGRMMLTDRNRSAMRKSLSQMFTEPKLHYHIVSSLALEFLLCFRRIHYTLSSCFSVSYILVSPKSSLHIFWPKF